MIIYLARSDAKVNINKRMVSEGMPQARKDIESLGRRLAKVETLKLDDRVKMIEGFVGGKLL